MAPQSIEALWQMNAPQLREELNKRQSRFVPKKILFYAPSFMYYEAEEYSFSHESFPTISITAEQCALNCKHCNRIVLESMRPATTPDQLFELCRRLKENHAEGCLISGGCRPDGSVPLEPFIDTIARIKKELGLTIFVHTGIIRKKTASALHNAGVDAALIDVIGSDETVREICHVKATVQEYENSLVALEESHLPFVPHIITGLHYGQLQGERAALNLIVRHMPSAVVIIAFMPIQGSEMGNTQPPRPEDIAKVIMAARVSLPNTPIVLGCMRPKGKERVDLDILALKAGVDAIAFPTREAIEYARQWGNEIAFSPFCCARIYSDAVSDRMSPQSSSLVKRGI